MITNLDGLPPSQGSEFLCGGIFVADFAWLSISAIGAVNGGEIMDLVAEESCTTDMITGGSCSGRVAGLQEQEERELTVWSILRWDEPVLAGKGSPYCA